MPCINNISYVDYTIQSPPSLLLFSSLFPSLSFPHFIDNLYFLKGKDLGLDVDTDVLSVRLGELQPNDAVLLLKELAPLINDEQAKVIAKLCGYLPLPIRIVGSTLNRYKYVLIICCFVYRELTVVFIISYVYCYLLFDTYYL